MREDFDRLGAHIAGEFGKLFEPPATAPADREALAGLIYQVYQDEGEAHPDPGGAIPASYAAADAVLARWRLVPVERDLPGPDWDDPDNPKIARGSAAFNNYLDASLDMGDDN